MKIYSRKRLTALIIFSITVTFAVGCVYYNTFFNARQAFNEAESTRKADRMRGGRVNKALYETAIEKSLKVIENYPNSKYYDDALFVLGVSYFYTDKYVSSEHRMRELLANYPDSKYAREAELYLAKAKLELQDEKDAMAIFEKIFREDFKQRFKAEAAIALGNYYFREKSYDEAIQYFLALRDSLGVKQEKLMAQKMIADSYFEDFNFREALGAYLQMLGMEPETGDKYHALYHAAQSSFRLMKISDGLDYLRTLANDEVYYDSLSSIRLLMGQGYEYDEEVGLAEDLYQEVLDQEKDRKLQGEAAYRLGLIYQFEYDELPKAKEYYDEAVKLARSTDFGRDALERSSAIGKIKEFKRTARLDTSATQEMIDEAALTQFKLAELYWLDLNKPDSAIIEMRYVVDSFPNSYYAPKAMVSLAGMYRDHKQDSGLAKHSLEFMLRVYPHSDFVPQALEALGLLGTPADTGYALLYLRKAEDFLDEEQFDSARYYYQYIVDNFPKSKYYAQARFSLIWMTENYSHPGDSSVYYAYSDFIDAFPTSEWADEAAEKLGLGANRPRPKQQKEEDTTAAIAQADDEFDDLFEDEQEDTTQTLDPIEAVYIGPSGEEIKNITLEPIEIREEFEYPVEAYRTGWEGTLYFQIFLDFSGEVVDYILKIRSESEEINREASKAVASMIFDPLRVPQELQDSWVVYKFEVRKPDHIR